MILAGCGERDILMLGIDERFTRLAENFIRSNIKEDIKAFITHNVAMKMAHLIVR